MTVKIAKMMAPALALLSVAMAGAPALAGDDMVGKRVFLQRCAMCHAAEPGKKSPVGPSLAGVVGRAPAAVPGYAYSPALRAEKAAWTAKRLDAFLAEPTKVVPGTRMTYPVADAKQREDILAYLATTGR